MGQVPFEPGFDYPAAHSYGCRWTFPRSFAPGVGGPAKPGKIGVLIGSYYNPCKNAEPK